jgi:DNA-binding transcriptional ArsR family regulator
MSAREEELLDEEHCDDEEHDHGGVVREVLDRLDDDETYRDASDLFGAFADPNRLKILDALRTGHEICVSDLMTITGMSQSAVSHALKLLRLRRLVDRRRQGRHVFYRLDDDHIVKLVEFALEHLAEAHPG